MSGFGDIAGGRLSYTCRCGWVDWGHALPGGATELREQFMAERSNNSTMAAVDITYKGEPAYIIHYGQSMSKRVPVVGVRLHASTRSDYVIQKGLSTAERESAALGLFLSASHDFEGMQNSGLYQFATDSGYSMEDLVSNVIGFYIAWKNITTEQAKSLCNEVAVAEAQRIWREFIEPLGGLGAPEAKNRTTIPQRFESPMCTDTSFPPQFQTITPSNAGTTWQKVNFDHIGRGALVAGNRIHVAAGGAASLSGPGGPGGGASGSW